MGKKSPGTSTTPILPIVNIQCTTPTAFGLNKCGQKHSYYGIDLIGVLPWFGTDSNIDIHNNFKNFQITSNLYIDKLSGENTTVIKV